MNPIFTIKDQDWIHSHLYEAKMLILGEDGAGKTERNEEFATSTIQTVATVMAIDNQV